MRPYLRAALAVSILCPTSAAHAEWHEAKSDHFIIFADQDPAKTRQFALELERFDSAARQLMNLGNPQLTDSQRVVIFVVPTIREVEKMAGVAGAAGFYTLRVEGSQAFVPSTRSIGADYSRWVLNHEYTHHLQLQRAEHAIPMWLSEGLAEFASTAAPNADGSMTFGAQSDGRQVVRGRLITIPVKRIVGDTAGRLDERQLDEFYSRSWLLVSYLMGDAPRRAQIDTYVAAINSGVAPSDAAEKIFGDFGKLERRLDEYLMGNALNGFKIPREAIRVGPVTVRKLSPGHAAMMHVRIRSSAGVDEKSAPVVEAEARKIAEQYPDDGDVQSRLAEASFDAKNFAGAAAAAEKAIAINPTDVHALTYRGWTALSQGEQKPETVNWEQIRADFIRAIKLDNQNPLPLYLFYQSFSAARQRPTPNAVDALLYAVKLAPRDPRVRLTAVAQLLNDGRLGEAKEVFRPVAFSPHQSVDGRNQAQKILAAIERGNGKEALALMEDEGK